MDCCLKETSRNLGATISEESGLELKIRVTYPSDIVSETQFMIYARGSASIAKVEIIQNHLHISLDVGSWLALSKYS